MHIKDFDFTNIEFASIGGNPPYEQAVAGDTRAIPIYQNFILDAIQNGNADIVTFIIPAKWFTLPTLADFRKQLANDRHIKKIVDFENDKDCFPTFKGTISGGCCYIVWDKKHHGPCTFVNRSGKKVISTQERYLNEFSDIIIRSNDAVSIVHKVQAKKHKSFSDIVSGMKPFGLPTNFTDYSEVEKPGHFRLYANGRICFVEKSKISKNLPLADYYKVFLSKAYGGIGKEKQNQVIGKPIIGHPDSICTETYLCIGCFTDYESAFNLSNYMQTKFFRYMVSITKNTQDNTKKTFNYVPFLPLDTNWTDEKLYAYFKLSKEEISVIEEKIREI